MATSSLYDIPLKKIDGSDATLAEYRGKVVLIVNVASKCGLTPQYEGLEAAYEAQREQGLVVLGFPSNDFAAQEPGDNDSIAAFCRGTFGVQFPMFGKLNVNSAPRHPLYAALIEAAPQAQAGSDSVLKGKLAQHGLLPKNDSDVMWNFEKFLIGRDGSVVGRFAPDITVDSPVLAEAIKSALAR
ncbi:glutathione peroxidase [Xylophilus rhododendri]|uniref:Glutathione peroxidase n=1 Tax=Xylophilus rhododendri TaxID=2697032 RepID=A0A857JCU7_9BURK|nr:glutathione peroxidase [Xylophilus rhododendri]QHJ01034.1 glutathione peroxidase [Xylophilus rhododendri]